MIKTVFSSMYAHKSNVNELIENLPPQYQPIIKYFIELNFNADFDVIKVDVLKNTITLITCEGWDTLPEPIIRKTQTYYYSFNLIKHIEDGFGKPIVKNYLNNPPIYHNKWNFVSDNYNGFDIELSKQRTNMLKLLIPEYSSLLNKIGFLNFWTDLCNKYDIPLNTP